MQGNLRIDDKAKQNKIRFILAKIALKYMKCDCMINKPNN